MDKKEIANKIKEVELCSGFNLGVKMSKYKNSKVIKAMVQNLSELNKNDPWAIGLLKGYEKNLSKSPDKKQKRMSELDIIFKEKEATKEKGKGQER